MLFKETLILLLVFSVTLSYSDEEEDSSSLISSIGLSNFCKNKLKKKKILCVCVFVCVFVSFCIPSYLRYLRHFPKYH